MKLKISLREISMETNHAYKIISLFEFLSFAWSISSKYAEKTLKNLHSVYSKECFNKSW